MPYEVWIYSALVALAVPVLWWALSAPKVISDKAVQNLGTARRPSDLRVLKLEVPAAERIALPILRSLGSAGHRFTPAGWIQRFEKNLGEAGKAGRWTPEQVIGAKIAATLLAGLWGLLRVFGDSSPQSLAISAAVVALSFFLPDLLLSAMASRRKEAIVLELPDILDQLTMSVEAGLGFEAAISRIAAKDQGILSQEFARLTQDIRLGTPRSEALHGLATRSGVDDLRHVVLSLRQAEKLGTPLADTLRVMADQLRTQRSLRAEEAANKLPIKMIFPLALCILPALFIVILAPAVIQLANTF